MVDATVKLGLDGVIFRSVPTFARGPSGNQTIARTLSIFFSIAMFDCLIPKGYVIFSGKFVTDVTDEFLVTGKSASRKHPGVLAPCRYVCGKYKPDKLSFDVSAIKPNSYAI